MQPHRPVRDGESDAEAARGLATGIVHAIERAQDGLALAFRDPRPPIADFDIDLPFSASYRLAKPDLHLGAVFCIPDRIADHVLNGAIEQFLVA